MQPDEFIFGNVTFRYLREEDLTGLAKMLAKESVCRHLFFGPNTAEETSAYFEPIVREIRAAANDHQIAEKQIFTLHRHGILLGYCGLLPVANSPGNFELGYTLDEPHWNQGYGTLACRFLTAFGFHKLGARRLTASYMDGNTGSEKILMKTGFRPEGRQKKYWIKKGSESDNMLTGITRAEWQAEPVYVIAALPEADYPNAQTVWEASVRATHDFLPEEGIQKLKPRILDSYLPAMEHRIGLYADFGKLVAFAGINGDMLEMLFIHPDYRGKGFGKTLMQTLFERFGVRRVDVNEQNPQAVGFYEKMGFHIIGRDELDPMGDPYPILHMELFN